MSFAINGSYIEQSGTDTDLSGLSGVTGVVTTTYSATGNFEDKVVYDLTGTGLGLKITGTLSHDPSTEVLIIGSTNPNRETIEITSTGIYNYGAEVTYSGGTHYTRGEGLVIRDYLDGTQKQWNADWAGIRINGQMNWKGGFISTARSIITNGNGNILIRQGVCKTWAKSLTKKDYIPRIGFNGYNTDVDGIEVYGHNGAFFGFALASIVTTNFTNVVIQGNTSGATAIAADQYNGNDNRSNPHQQIDNVDDLSVGNPWAGRAWQERVNVWTNYGGGVTLKDYLSDANSTGVSARGIVIAQKQVEPTVLDTSGTALQDVKVLIKEESDGNEATSTYLADFNYNDITYYASARNQIKTTDATGATPQFITGLFLAYKPTRYTALIRNVKTLNGGQTQVTRQFGYNYLLNSGSLRLDGTGVLEPTFVMIDDISVTQTSKAIVDAYTTLENPAKLYDGAKAYLYDNWAGEGSLLLTRAGDSIDLGNNSLVIDATATQPIAVSGTTITIKATTFAGNLTTGTGTITEVNGASVAGTVTDVNGVRSTSTLTLTGLKVGTEVRIYDAGTNTELGGVESSLTTYTIGLTVSAVDIVIHSLGYLNQVLENVATTSDTTLPISQVVDRQYNNPV